MRNAFQKFIVSLAPVMMFAAPILAQTAGDKKAPSPFSFGNPMIMMMLFMFLIIWFLMIRPEQKKQKERQKMLSALKKGDKVMTAAGMYGIVGNVKDNSVMVKVADNTTIEFAKSAVTSVMNSDGSEKTAEKAEKELEKK
jgi:preprotein translocase subunit YajC